MKTWNCLSEASCSAAISRRRVLVPGEEGRADSPLRERGIHEADLRVGARPVDLLIPGHTAVGDRPTVDLGDEQVALGVAALEVVVVGGHAFDRLDAIQSLSSNDGVDDADEMHVVGAALEGPEDDIGDLRKRWHVRNHYHPIHRNACDHCFSAQADKEGPT